MPIFTPERSAELNATFASFNLSTKAALMLILNDQPQALEDVTDRFVELYQETALHDLRRQIVRTFVGKSLEPHGFARTEYIKNTPLLTATEFGQKMGWYAAAALLHFESEQGISLAPILGPASGKKGGLTTPYVRMLLLLELLGGSQNQIELEKTLGIPPWTIRDSLAHFSQWRIIEYGSDRQVKEKEQRYEVANNQLFQKENGQLTIQPIRSNKPLTFGVVEAIEHLLSRSEVITQQTVFSELPQSFIQERKEDSLREQITGILSGLAKKGYLTKQVNETQTNSQATVTPQGELITTQYILPIVNFLQNPSMQNDDLVNQVRENLPQYTQKTGALIAPYTKAHAMQQKEQIAFSIMEQLPSWGGEETGKTIDELVKFFSFSRSALSSILTKLAENGQVMSVVKKNVRYFWKK